jgi:hypothetical protein
MNVSIPEGWKAGTYDKFAVLSAAEPHVSLSWLEGLRWFCFYTQEKTSYLFSSTLP